MVRLLAEDGLKDLRGILRLPGLEHLFRRGHGVIEATRRIAAAHLGELLDELLDLAFGHRPLEAIDRLALVEGIDRRDRLDAELTRDLLGFVDIDLGHLHSALLRAHGRFELGAQRLARPAPGRPEIDDDRNLLAGLDDIRHEVLFSDILDDIGVVRGRLSKLDHGGLRLANGVC